MHKSKIVLVFILLFFSGCSTWEKWNIGFDKNSEPPPPPVTETAQPFTDIPVPSGFSRRARRLAVLRIRPALLHFPKSLHSLLHH